MTIFNSIKKKHATLYVKGDLKFITSAHNSSVETMNEQMSSPLEDLFNDSDSFEDPEAFSDF